LQVVAGQKRRADLGLFFEFAGPFLHKLVVVEPPVGAEAVEAVQFEFEGEGVAQEHAAQSGFAHVFHVLELHVMQDGGDDFIGLFAGKFEALQNGFGHLRADFFVAVKVDGVAVRIAGGGDGLGDVVEERGPGQRGRGVGRQFLQHEPDVLIDGAFGVVIGRLIADDGGENLGEDLLEQTAFAEQVQSARGVGRPEEFQEFLADALGADVEDLRGAGLERGEGFGFDLKIKLRGEAHGAQEAEIIFGETFGGRADGAKEFGAQIAFAADPVVQLLRDGVEEKAVDGEIAAGGVGLGVAEGDLFRMAAVLVIGLGAEGGDLEFAAGIEDDEDAELAADGNGAREKGLDLGGESGGGDVVVLGIAAEEAVADAAADPVRGVAGRLEAADDAGGEVGQGRVHSEELNHKDTTDTKAEFVLTQRRKDARTQRGNLNHEWTQIHTEQAEPAPNIADEEGETRMARIFIKGENRLNNEVTKEPSGDEDGEFKRS
jgi:hypothetical protein